MTQWVEEPAGGRPRGPSGIAHAWVQVLVRPRRFFANGVAPGDQAPGLTFAAVVVLLEEATRLALVEGAVPVLRGRPGVSAALWLLAAVVLIAPAAVHLTAAAETLALMAVAPDRGGVSETVQVICYAMAPCVVAGVPGPVGDVPWLRLAAVAWGVGLLVLGTSEVHDVSAPRAVAAALVPAVVIFGVGFQGIDAAWAAADATAEGLAALQ